MTVQWTAPRRPLLAGLLFVAAVGVHLGALDCGFIAYDDDAYVYANPHIRDGFTAHSVRWALTAHLTHDALPHLDYWQPVTVFSRILDVELFGMDARGHHATNLLLHGLNAALLFLVLESLTGAPWRCTLAAALFALHPLRVESVVWVTERKDVLSGLFFMLTLGAYVRYVRRRGRRAYLLVAVLLATGLMAKAVLVTLPAVLLLLDSWPLRRFGPGNWSALRPAVLEKAPLVALAAASFGLAALAHSRGDFMVPLATRSLGARLGGGLVEYVLAVWRFAYPYPMALPRPFPLEPWPWWIALASGALAIAITVAAVRGAATRPYLAVGWAWFVIVLAPAVGATQAGAQPLADRFMYLPHIGLALALAWALGDAAASNGRRRALATAASALALATLGVATVRQTRHWRDSTTLFSHAVASTRDNFAAHFNLGNALVAAGRPEDAAAQYRAVIAINPDHARAHNNLANLHFAAGRRTEAVGEYREALRLSPGYPDANNNLGMLLAQAGDREGARRHLEAAVRGRAGFADPLLNLARLDADEGRPQDALQRLAEALESHPDLVPAHVSRGLLLARLGRLADAETHFRAAARLKPGDAAIRNNLGRALDLLGRRQQAMAEYRAAAALAPGEGLSRLNLGRLLVAEGRNTEAIAPLDEAVRLLPRDAEARLLLARSLRATGDEEAACVHHRAAAALDATLAGEVRAACGR